MFNSRKQAQAEQIQQFEQANYIKDSVRFDAFALETQQARKIPVLLPLITLFNIIAIIFESFLHVNLGRDYVIPMRLLLRLFIDMGENGGAALGIFIIFIAGLALYADSAETFLMEFWDVFINFVLSGFILWFFAVGISAMILQAVYSFVAHRANNERFSFSNGTPWIYYLTRVPFFKSPEYILWVEPLMMIFAGLAFYFGGGEGGQYFAAFACCYLIRNIHIYLILDKGKVQRANIAIKSIAETQHQEEAQQATKKAAIKNAVSSQSNEVEKFID